MTCQKKCELSGADLFCTLLETYHSKGVERKKRSICKSSVKFWYCWLLGGHATKLQRRQTNVGQCPDREENWCCHWESEQSQVYGNSATGQVWGECTSAVLKLAKTGRKWIIKPCILELWRKAMNNSVHSLRLDASGAFFTSKALLEKLIQKRNK